MKQTCWEIRDNKKWIVNLSLKDEWLELFDYNYDPLKDNGGWPWYGEGKATLLKDANNWFEKNNIAIRVTDVEAGEEYYIWEVEDSS